MRISFTALQTFKTCPLKFKLSQIDRIRTPKMPEAVFGTLMHDCLEKVYNPNRETPATEQEILDYLNKKWSPEIYKDPVRETSDFASAVKIIKDFFAKNNPADAQIVSLERSFGIPIMVGDREYQITGKIDRIDKTPDDSFEIIDYKTAKKMPAQKYIDDNLQLAVYHLGLVSLWPQIESDDRPVQTSLYFLRHGEKLSSRKNKENLKEARAEIMKDLLEVENQQQKNEWRAIPNPLCSWCGYKHLCPMFRHQFSETPLPDAEKMKEIVEEFLELKDQAKKLRQKETEFKHLVDKYMEANEIERIFGDNGFITRSQSEIFSFDPVKIREVLEPLNRFMEIIKVDNTKLKKLLKEVSPADKERIEEAKRLERRSKTFKASRKTL